MTRTKSFLAGLAAVVAMAVVAPAAHAVNNPCAGNAAIGCHVVAAGSSAQFLGSGLGADTLAFANITSGTTCSFHYTAKNAGNYVDDRDGAIIRNEPGNIWVVWIANQDGSTCANSLGTTGITDIWTDLSVDSTVGVRMFAAGLASGPGAKLQVNVPPPAPGNLIAPATLWADGNPDVALPSGVSTALFNSHVNLGLTDIRPEDAAFATARSYSGPSSCTGTGTCTKLGYTSSNFGVGASIQSDLGCPGSCSPTIATPVNFALAGTDPFTGQNIRSFTTIPIGAAPIVWIYNNNAEAPGVYPTDVKTGITPGKHVTGQVYPLADLFNGTTVCTEANPTFHSTGSGSANIKVAIREPLSGTMNTTEWSTFRSFGNSGKGGSQEWLINPALQGGGYTAGSNYNPTDLNCVGGGGKRVRGVSNGDITKWVNTTPNTIGYMFWSFANANSVNGGKGLNANYTYFTEDGVDPISLGTANQQLPGCLGPCPATLWPLDSNGNINSLPNVRNGTYKTWSLYRWMVPSPDADPLGPTALAVSTQNAVDVSYADFVPFIPTTTAAGTDAGLGVYRSHVKRCNIADYTCPTGDTILPHNGAFSGSEFASTLGGGNEAGGDMGGLVYGPYLGGGTQGSLAAGVVDVTRNSTTVAKDSGQSFVADGSWTNQTILLDATVDANGVCQGTAYTIASVTNTTTLKLTTPYTGSTNDLDPACTPAQHPGTLSKAQ